MAKRKYHMGDFKNTGGTPIKMPKGKDNPCFGLKSKTRKGYKK